MKEVRNANLNQLLNSSEFLYTFSPYQFLKDDQNNLDTLLNRIELGEFLNLLFTASPPDFDVICNCLKNRHQKNSNYAPLMRAFVVDSASLMNLFLAMEMTNYGDYIPALAARLGFENLNIEDAKEELNRYVYGNNGNGSNLKILLDELYKIDEGFRDCGPSVSNFLFKLHTDQPNKLIELLMVIPDLRDMFYRTASSDGFDCSYSFSHDDMASLMSNNYSEISWNKLIDAFGTNTLLTYFVNNQNSYFMNQAVLYNKTLLTNTQQNQNLYGGNYGGLENYFTYIRNYFGQGLYDQITAGFMQQSSVYTDSLRLEEWHLYGSSRIGIYQTNKAMAQRTVRIENGITTQLSNTHIEQLSLTCFYTERGAKRYELTNHLGNVLTVVTDKKLPVCTGTSVSYFIADIVSATDYSPFGAPLAERTWQGSEYRYGYNSKERDNEINGFGNAYDFGARIYNGRLGRWMSLDPLMQKYPSSSPFNFCLNNPILNIDPDGKFVIAVTGSLNGFFLFAGVSYGTGFAIGNDGAAALAYAQANFGLGFEGSASINVSVFPTMKTVDDLRGEGISIDASGAYLGKFGVGYQYSSGNHGGSGSFGGGMGAHISFNKSTTVLKKITLDQMNNYLNGENVEGMNNDFAINSRQLIKKELINSMNHRIADLNKNIKTNNNKIERNNKIINKYKNSSSADKAKMKSKVGEAMEENKKLTNENHNNVTERNEICEIKSKLSS